MRRFESSRPSRPYRLLSHYLGKGKKFRLSRGLACVPFSPSGTTVVSGKPGGFAVDGRPSCTVSIMEFLDGKVARETQYFGGDDDEGRKSKRPLAGSEPMSVSGAKPAFD